MKVLRTAAETREWRATAGRTGLVPTMGALHAGHVSLVERAGRDGGAVVASIFVNPTQFGPREDFGAYPRREAEDLAMLDRAGVAAAFVPSVAEMYPPDDTMSVDPGPIAAPLEGAARPGHFTGVATVVAKLFDVVQPDTAYFGQKDFQQLRVLQTMARQGYPKIRVIGCPIVREPDGLAMSSRNAYLSPEDRARALALSRGLFAARRLWERGERDPDDLRDAVRRRVVPSGVSLEYVSAADPFTLAELRAPADRAVLSLAARVGKARLIDNVLLGMDVSELS
ncbi:MAG TPA: pantoate--beta-alanine ligase [Verrucomicrobiae bacterium]|nr:pantoate--beta-alanine ligase [Verrucomicrobiae bacterium]